MRLRERDKRKVTIHTMTGLEADRYTWDAGTTIWAAIYPAIEEMSARITGARMDETRILLYDGTQKMETGMGVCVEDADGRPDFRVIALEQWDHVRAKIQRIPEGKRG